MKKVYPHLNNEWNVEKVDGAKGAWAVFKEECAKTGWRDHRHRSENAAKKFNAAAATAYKKIARARSESYRDTLLDAESPAFKKWCLSIPVEF